MMSRVGETDACFAVKGEAMEASPSLTTGALRLSPSSFISSNAFLSFRRCFSAAERWRLGGGTDWFEDSEEDLGFFCFVVLPSTEDACEIASPVLVGGMAFNRAIPTWA